MIRNSLYHYFAVLAAAILITHCGQTSYVPSPGFELTLRVTNPVNSFKLQMGINLHPADSTRARMFVHRMSGPYTALDYREPNTIRKNIADTISLSRNEFENLFQRVADLKEHPAESETPSLQENFYSIRVTDTFMPIDVSAFESGDSPANALAEYLMRLFSNQFPAVSLWSSESAVKLIKDERGRVDSVTIRHKEKKIEYFVNEKEIPLPEDHFMDLWSVMESNQVWKLRSDSTYRKFPLKYRMNVSMNGLNTGWEVYAPHLLNDKRYFDIINAVETMNGAGIPN